MAQRRSPKLPVLRAARWLKKQSRSEDVIAPLLLAVAGSLILMGLGIGLASVSALLGGITALAGLLAMMFATVALFVSNLTDPLKSVGVHPIVGAIVGSLVVALFCCWLGADVILAQAPLRHHHISVTARVIADGFQAWSPALALPLAGFLAVRYVRLFNQRRQRVSDTERILALLEELTAERAGSGDPKAADKNIPSRHPRPVRRTTPRHERRSK